MPLVVRVGLIAAAVVVLGVGDRGRRAPARGTWSLGDRRRPGPRAPRRRPGDVPDDHRRAGRLDWNHEIAGPGARQIVLDLAENLELENQALLRGDATILEAVDHGDRLDDMRGRLAEADATGDTVIERYQIDDVNVTLLVPFGKQDGLSLGLRIHRHRGRGDATTPAGASQSRTTSPFATTFVVRQVDGRPLAQRRRVPAARRRLTTLVI